MTHKNCDTRAERRRRLLSNAVLLAAVALVLFAAQTASACPSCKAALANQDGKGGDLVTGMMYSILFMLSMPFAIFGSFSGYFYYLVRQARRQQKNGDSPLSGQQSNEIRGE
jgi:hypothetical protein